MPDQNDQPQVRDKRVIPPGVLPKNAQTWIVIGVAVLMVGVIALSGKNQPSPRKPAPGPAALPIDPNAARIQEYQTRIEEQTRRLQAEQAELGRAERSGLGAQAAPAGDAPVRALALPYDREAPAGPDPLQAEQKKREYLSLFSPNVVVSERKKTATGLLPAPNPAAGLNPAESLLKVLPLYSALAALQSNSTSGLPKAQATPAPSGATGIPSDDKSDVETSGLSAADGKPYRIFEGTVLETVLTNRLDGSFSGPVNCMVTTNVYSRDGRHLLIPQGSRVLGEVQPVDSMGQQRLAVFFHRLIMPDGFSVNLDQFQGLNQIGETGLRDKINHHYAQVFGVSVAIGALAGLSQAHSGTDSDPSWTNAYRDGIASSLSQSSLQILNRYLNVLPTFTIREGHRVKVYLSQDLLVPAYDRHQMPSNI